MVTAGTVHPALVKASWRTEPGARRVIEALAARGAETRFVGGCVRDALAGRERPTLDIDLCTTATPEVMLAVFDADGIKAIPTGLEHGTVTAVIEHRPYEVTTLRIDVRTDGRHAEVAFTDDFVADAARRDFTINTMSADLEGRLFDPFDGRSDLAAGRIRFVGDARTRIAEDRLRILRFFRFLAAYGTATPDGETLAALADGRVDLDLLAGERIQTEMRKLLETPDPSSSLGWMAKTGVLEQLFGTPASLKLVKALIGLEPRADAWRRLAALIRPLPDPQKRANQVRERWRLSTQDGTRLERLVAAKTPAWTTSDDLRRAIHLEGRSFVVDELLLAAAADQTQTQALNAAAMCAAGLDVPTFPLAGRDLLAVGLEPGPALGAMLREIEQWWLAGGLKADRMACLLEVERRSKPHNR